MGTDIFMFLEFKLSSGEWIADKHHHAENESVCMGIPAAYRNYSIFAALAGVRGDGPEPKGLPADVSDKVVELMAADDNYNTHTSYCNINELERVSRLYHPHDLGNCDPFDYHTSTSYMSICKYAQKMIDTGDYKDARVVFTFDGE